MLVKEASIVFNIEPFVGISSPIILTTAFVNEIDSEVAQSIILQTWNPQGGNFGSSTDKPNI